jgi:hypothetical protein
MSPIAVVARIATEPVEKSLDQKLANKIKDEVVTKSEECYEDETGNVRMCKKCEQKSRNFVGNYNKYNMQERVNLVNFLKQLNEKNYAEAHKYLKKVMESKLANRIAKNKNVRLF